MSLKNFFSPAVCSTISHAWKLKPILHSQEKPFHLKVIFAVFWKLPRYCPTVDFFIPYNFAFYMAVVILEVELINSWIFAPN